MLTFKRHGLYFQKIFNRNPFPDCDEKFLFCFCNVPADIGTHVLPKCMFVPYIVYIRHVSQYTPIFDFEGSMIPGVERFFREFGAIQTPFFTITRGNLSLLYRAWLKIKERI